MTIGELLVEINGDNSGLTKALKGSTSQTDSAIDFMVKKVATAAVAWKAVDLAIKGIEYNKAAEQAEIAFGVFLGSAEAAKNMIEDLRDLAKETPLEFAEVRDAAKRLSAFGVEADKLVPTMRMLADVSAGLQIPIGDLAYLFGTIRTQGKAMTVDINQFANRGIPIWEELAKVTGKSGAELRKMVEAGAIGFPQVNEAFENMTTEGGKFFNMAVLQMDSLAGAQSNLNDNFEVWLGNITEGLSGPLKGLSGWASDWFSKNTAQLKQNGEEWAALFDGIAKATGFGKYNAQVQAHWKGVITAMRLTAVEQDKLLDQAISIAQTYPEIHKKNNGDISKTVAAISEKYKISAEDVRKILLNVTDVDAKTKAVLKSEIDRGVTGKEVLATATDYAALEKKSAAEAATFAQAKQAQQEAFTKAFAAYSAEFDQYTAKAARDGVDQIETLKKQVDIRNKYKDVLTETYAKGLISEKQYQDEITRVNALNAKNLKTVNEVSEAQELLKKNVWTTADGYFELQDKAKIAAVATKDIADESSKLPPYWNEVKESSATVADSALVMQLIFKKLSEDAIAIGDGLGTAADHLGGLASAARKFEQDELADMLAGFSDIANSAGSVVANFAKGDYVAAAVSGVMLIADVWSTFWGGQSEAQKKADEEARKAEEERVEAVRRLNDEYQAKFDSDLVRLQKERDERLAYARKIGADVYNIEAYYAGQIEKVRRTTADISVESGAVEAEKARIRAKYDALKGAEIQAIKDKNQSVAVEIAKEWAKGRIIANSSDWLNVALQETKSQFDAWAVQAAQTGIAALDQAMQTELGKVVYNLQLFQERAQGAMDSVGKSLADGLKSGMSGEDFSTTIMTMLRDMAIDAAIIAGGFQEQFKEIGVMVAEAMKDGFQEGELDAISASIDDLYTKAMAAVNPINQLFASKGLEIPGFAGGTSFAPGGWSWVGENGPELMNVPRGAQIIPSSSSMALSKAVSGSTVTHGDTNIHIQSNAPLDPYQTARAVQQVQESLAFAGAY